MRARWVLVGVFLISLIAVLPARAFAYTGQDLTITTGTGSAWVTGGYDFHGTASATRGSFRPFEGADNITLVFWFKVTQVAAVNLLYSQRESASSQLRLYTDTSGHIVGQVCTGDAITVTTTATVTVNKMQLAVLTWDQDLNGGKPDLYINTTKTEAATGMVNIGDADIDAVFAMANDGTSKANATIYFMAVDHHKWTQTEVNTFFGVGSEGPFTYFPNYYWTLNDASGTNVDGNSPDWFQVETWVLDPNANAWYSVENWTIDIYALDDLGWHLVEAWELNFNGHSWFPSPLVDIEFFMFLAGAIGLTISGTVFLGKVKAKDPSGVYIWLVFVVLCGALMLGVLL